MATARVTISGEQSAEELQTIIAKNAAYRTRDDVVMAENLIDAAEALLAIPLSEFDHAGERARVEIQIVEKRLDRAIAWLATQRACNARPRHFIPARDWNC